MRAASAGVLLLAVVLGQADDGAATAVASFAPGSGQGARSVIRGEGVAEATKTREVIWSVELRSAFVPTLTEIVAEWSHVEAGSVIARLDTPWLEDERCEKDQRLRVAEAEALQTEAHAQAVQAELGSRVRTAQADLSGAEEYLTALKALPSVADREQLAARIEENRLQRRSADEGLALLQELRKEGLCSAAEVAEARRGQKRQEAEAAYLQSVSERLEALSTSFDVRRAEVAAQKLKTQLEIAKHRRQLESERQRLLCDASRQTRVAQAQREYDLSLRRMDALNVRAPASGYVLYGRGEDYWNPARERLCPGRPIYYGQALARIIEPGKVRVEAKIAEEELLRVAVGDPAEVRFPGLPGQLYEGVVEAVLPIIEASESELLETATEVLQRHGRVDVAVAGNDERVRPGMKAEVSIFPARAVEATGSDQMAAPDPTADPVTVLRGHLETKSSHLIRCPFQGRIVWVAATGALVEQGEPLARLSPGLAIDWQAQDESELKRLESLRKAAEVEVQLKENLVPLLGEEAQVDVTLARLDVQELESRPEAPERIKAENTLAEAERQLQHTRQQLDAYRKLASQRLAREADVRQRELQVTRAQADVSAAQAKLDDALAGASDLERAIAQANLKLALASLKKTCALAELDLKTAKAELETAEARLAAFRAQAERRRRKAEQAQVESPVKGLVRWCWAEEGTELQAGWYFMAIADMEQAVVHAMLDESDYFKVIPGAPARVKLAGVPGKVFGGRVADVVDWPELSAWTRRYFGETRVRPGKLFRVTIELEEEPPMCIGMSAVVEILPPDDGGRDSEGNRAARTEPRAKEVETHGGVD